MEYTIRQYFEVSFIASKSIVIYQTSCMLATLTGVNYF